MPVLIVRSTLLATMIFLGGWLGLQMIVPPAYASPLWPPAGLALGALLVWGRKLWPAVFIGAMTNEILVGSHVAGDIDANVLISSALIAVGITLQALSGWALSEKYLEKGTPALDSPRQILLFFLLTAPVACVIAATAGTVLLTAFGLMPLRQVGQSWFHWWLGDSLGVLVLTPLMLCLFAQPRQLWAARLSRVALPLSVTLAALIAIFVSMSRSEMARVQLAFDNEAGAMDRLVVEYANNAIDSSLALRDLYAAKGSVSREQFASFSLSLLQRHPELQALEWLPRVPKAELRDFEQSIRDEGFDGFEVVERSADNRLIPVRERDEYFPITFVEPMANNRQVFGLDSTADPLSRESKALARLHGKPSVSGRLLLLQRQDLEPAVLLSIPVFADFDSKDGLAGFVSAVILPARLIETALEGLDLSLFSLNLQDLDAESGQAELYSKAADNASVKPSGFMHWRHEFLFGDRRWQLTIEPAGDFVAARSSMLPWFTLLGGFGFTGLMSILLLIISGRTARVEALIEARTLDLQKANDELRLVGQTLRESEYRLRTILDSEPECVKLVDAGGFLLEMNPAGLAMIDAEHIDQVRGYSVEKLLLPQYRTQFKRLAGKVFTGQSGRMEYEILGLKGSHRWMETHAVPMRDGEGKIFAVLSVTRDISERKKAEEELKLAARVFGEAHEGILITDADANIIDVNPTFCEITGYSKEEILGKNPRVLQSGKHDNQFYQDMWQTLVTSRHWRGEVWNRRKNGELYAELLTMSALCNERGEVINFIGLLSDITHFKQQQQMLELLAHYDPLTQLPNRNLFADRLLQAIAHSKREKSLLAVSFLDLDGFKPVNDQFGHDIGDRVLIEVARRIKSCIREQDTVSRHGGDEFILLMGDLHSVAQCEHTLTSIHQAIIEPYAIDGQHLSIGVSSGMTVYPLDDADPDTLLRHADQAMYQAKLSGKNRYQLFDIGQDRLLIDRNKQLKEIEKAFADGQFCLYYQPKINLKTGRITGVEALIRWMHPEQGVLSPQAFLPVVASTDLEIRIGHWVMEQAWLQLAAWFEQDLKLEVSVNISAYHLLLPEFVDYLQTILSKKPAVPSHYLQLEILESTALDDLSAVNRIVKICRDTLGVSTALDDFGTGYSSLTHLRHLPVDGVKIDKGFVRDMLDDPDDYAIVEAVIGLSQAFGHEVIAEGVETEEQGLILLLLGCHLAQGYAIAKPMPA
ncbi:MAG: EAL domain-containing protein, partial [Methylomonas sp.]|nr:EAL domain-containing protein [Methylomonas sp.]